MRIEAGKDNSDLKYIYLILTLALQFVLVFILKFLDNYSLIVSIFIGCSLAGLIMRQGTEQENNTLKDLSWGLLFGSLISLILAISFEMLFFGRIT
jgi:hypothetical protein